MQGPQAPDADPGEAVATVDGQAVGANVSRLDNSLVIDAGEIKATVYGLDASGQKIALNADGNLALEPGDTVVMETAGYEPNEGVEVWMHSDPVKLGELMVNGAGTAKGSFMIPEGLPTGNHRVLLAGTTGTGKDSVLGLGLRIGAWEKESNTSKWIISLAIALAVTLGLLIPTTTRRRRRSMNV